MSDRIGITEGQRIAYHNPSTGYKWHIRDTMIPKGSHSFESKRVKVIESPGVYLVGFTALHEGNINEFLRDHDIKTFTPWGTESDLPEAKREDHSWDDLRNARGSDSELLVELSGRLCYMSYDRPRPGGLDTFIKNLKAEGHGSVFEHPHYSFILSGVSRNLTLEGNRHRPFSISQLSGRFVDAAEVGFVADPDLLQPETEAELTEWAGKCRSAFDHYERAYQLNYARQLAKWRRDNTSDKQPLAPLTPDKKDERKITKKARERARDILPGCLETRILYTVNTRAIRFIFEKRCHADAAFEIRRAFNGVFRAIKAHDPKLFADFETEPLPDGTFAVVTPYPKI